MKKAQRSLPNNKSSQFTQQSVITEEINIEHYIIEDLEEGKIFERYSAKRRTLRRTI